MVLYSNIFTFICIYIKNFYTFWDSLKILVHLQNYYVQHDHHNYQTLFLHILKFMVESHTILNIYQKIQTLYQSLFANNL